MSEKGNWYSVVWSCSYSSHQGFDESGDPGRAEYHDPVEIDFYKFLFAFNSQCLPAGLLGAQAALFTFMAIHA